MAFLIKKQQAMNANLSEQKAPDGLPVSKRLNQSARRLTPSRERTFQKGLNFQSLHVLRSCTHRARCILLPKVQQPQKRPIVV